MTVLTPADRAPREASCAPPCGSTDSWRPTGDRRENTYTAGMYSGKRHRCGFNIQVVGSAYGRLVMVGDPQPGAMHDARAWRASGLAAFSPAGSTPTADPAASPTPPTPAPDCAYPDAKPAGQDHTESAREFNHAIASRRASVERVIAHLKNWKLLATGYRGLLDRFPQLLDTIIKLEIYRTS